MPQLRHFDRLNTARFVTFSCYHRHRLLTSVPVINVFLEELDDVRKHHGLKLFGYVVMPEHVHLVLWLPDDLELGKVVGQLKSLSARRMLPILQAERQSSLDRLKTERGNQGRHAFWQIRCYDHNCRSPETVKVKIEYRHKNPVTRGLVQYPGDWRWSSFNWYEGCEDVPLAMDEVL